MLNHLGKTNLALIDGETVKIKVVKTKRPSNRKGKVIYDNNVINVLTEIWGFFGYKCGKYLASFLRGNMPFLERNDVKDFHVTPEIKQKLLKISPSTIDIKLKGEKAKLQIRGISGTKCGEAALIKQIPIRTHYNNDERNIPGYFQIDTVHHCGSSDSGEFNLTLTVTDVATGWSELRSLRNKAHCWTLQHLQNIYNTLPFKTIELHSDNGSEFINHDTVDWWKLLKNLYLTRSRSHHSNDNCFAEQRNNAFVRNYVGYYRYDTEEELAALTRVYESLCPLLNFFMPNKKLVSKTTAGSKTIKKYDQPKTPYQRLLESSSVTIAEKAQLTCLYNLYNPVNLQQDVHRAVNALLAAHRAKVTFSK
jgi:hypothetical protein